jgi:hypothetical protein
MDATAIVTIAMESTAHVRSSLGTALITTQSRSHSAPKRASTIHTNHSPHPTLRLTSPLWVYLIDDMIEYMGATREMAMKPTTPPTSRVSTGSASDANRCTDRSTSLS